MGYINNHQTDKILKKKNNVSIFKNTDLKIEIRANLAEIDFFWHNFKFIDKKDTPKQITK